MSDFDYPRILEDLHREYQKKIEILEAQLQLYREIFEKVASDASEPNPDLDAYAGVS